MPRSAVGKNAILLILLAVGGLNAQSSQEIRQAVDRAISPIERSAGAFVTKRACVSCHHNILPILLADVARTRGVRFDPTMLEAVEAKTFWSLRGPKALENVVAGTTLNDPTPNDSFLLVAAHAAGIAPDAVTAAYARRLVNWQRDGHWITSDFRPPHSSSYFTATATAVRAIQLYAPEERDCILRAREWLIRTNPLSTEDASFRLLGLVWSGAGKHEIETASRELLAMRDAALPNSSAAWPQVAGYPADAYSTGESLFALHEAGLPMPDLALRFLISTQASDGTWHVHTRMLSPADVSPPYFTTGFPYEKDEYLSYAGTVWATMALLSTLPTVAAERPPMKEVAASVPEMKDTLKFAAMRGDIKAVRGFLAGGAEPSAEALSQAVTFGYPDIVKLLVDAGASAKITESSGINLLHWAAIANRPAVIPVLVKAGVPINAKDHNGYTPLMYAATIDFGDRAVWNALLKAGADPNIRNADGRTATEQAKIFLKSRN